MSNLAPFTEPGAAVQISGDVVVQSSGAWLASGIIPNISGQAVSISGQNVVVSSGAISVVSGSITVNSGQVAVSGLFAGWSGNFISGAGATSGALTVTNRLYDLSGATWNYHTTPNSGGTSAFVSIQPMSYVWAPLSGIGFGAGATNSGIPSLSGGVSLSSGKVNVAVVRNLSGNADMYVGGSGSRPFSGFGFVLHGGDGITFNIPNFNQIYMFANTSGQLISYIGTAFN